MSGPTVPREKVLELVVLFQQRLVCEAQKAGTLAKMIRACISTLQCDPKNTRAYRVAQGFSAEVKAVKEHREDQKRAWLYLEFVATQLENMSGNLTETEEKTDVPGC